MVTFRLQAAVEIGTIVHVFPVAMVVVVELRLPMQLGDVIEFRRVQHTFAAPTAPGKADRGHEFKSAQTIVYTDFDIILGQSSHVLAGQLYAPPHTRRATGSA